ERVVTNLDRIQEELTGQFELLEMAEAEDDEDTANAVIEDVASTQTAIEKLEFARMFSGEMDPNNAYIDIQSGSGGTEAQDWANILLRMYLRWAESKGFEVELM
ncbi:MAG TPA: PCRF domain-containing protein, partial [Thiotrichales bacterium]|nr:PCRF domain-containing protein [Thiotrichales bacterium]